MMAITCGYFDSQNGDRKYNADTMSKYFRGLVSRGVLQNLLGSFQVMANNGTMEVTIKPGRAYFSDGKWMESDAEISVAVDPSEVTLNRIDRIVLQKNSAEATRNCTYVYKKGTPATSPMPPALTADEHIEEMSLCQIYVGKLVKTISQSNITDERPNTEVCGFVHGLIEQIDTTDAFAQYDAAFKEWFDEVKEKFASATLIRQYTSHYVTSTDNESVIPIQIPQYVWAIDILNVYVNGLKLTPDVEYTKGSTNITLTLPLEKGQSVDFEVLKGEDEQPDVLKS